MSLQNTGGTDVLSYSASKGWTKFDIPGEFDNTIYNSENEAYRVDWIDLSSIWLGKLLVGCSSISAEEARNNKNNTYGHPPYTIKNGLRNSPAKTFYSEMGGRDNFKLLVNSKVLYIQQTQGKPSGVVYESEAGDITKVSLAEGGVVVVAAGALSTPQLLMQSGIGPQDELEALASAGSFDGVGRQLGEQDSWVINEAVGKVVFDAAVVYASFTHPGMVPFLNTQRPEDAIMQFVKNQTGPWSIPGPVMTAYETMEISGREYEFQTTVLPHGFGDNYETNEAYTLAMLINKPESRDYISVKGNSFI